MTIIAITTSNSIKVKAPGADRWFGGADFIRPSGLRTPSSPGISCCGWRRNPKESSVQLFRNDGTAENEHALAGPDSPFAAMEIPRGRSTDVCQVTPFINRRVIAASSEGHVANCSHPATNDHLRTGPDGTMPKALLRGVLHCGGGPLGGRGVEACAGVHVFNILSPAPNNHFRHGPNRSVTSTRAWRAVGWQQGPGVTTRIVTAARPKRNLVGRIVDASTNDHFVAGPHGRWLHARFGRAFF